jgi:predicted RNA-binding protein with TRAM domain
MRYIGGGGEGVRKIPGLVLFANDAKKNIFGVGTADVTKYFF